MAAMKSGLIASLLLLASNAYANSSAIKVDEEMKKRPEVQALIQEYKKIVSSKPNPCADPKYFGITTIRVDGEKRARYYVDGKGIACIPSRMRPNEPWRVTRGSWTPDLHREYRAFVNAIGTAVESGRCSTVDSCMISSANFLRTKTDMEAFHYSDCADFPYYLRAYFSFRKGLPFTYASQMRPRPLTEEDQRRVNAREARARELEDKQKRGVQLTKAEEQELKSLLKSRENRNDPRYTTNGNWVAKRNWVLPGRNLSFYSWAAQFPNVISTATMRVAWNMGQSLRLKNGEVLYEGEPDFYSAALTIGGITPGTVVYKHDGHIAVVYRIDYEKGEIYYMDAHPDNSLTWGVIDETWTKGMSGRPTWGGGFKNFRPTIIEKDPWGGQTIRLVKDHEIDPISISYEQYELFTDSKAKVMVALSDNTPAEVDYLDFLRLRMTMGKYRLNPAEQFRDDLVRLCKTMQSRRDAVLAATEKGIHLQRHPDRLPGNIYGAQGEWERFSTPGRDVALKQRVGALIDSLVKYRRMLVERSPLLAPGTTIATLKADAHYAWNEVAESCRISYKASNGKERSFNLKEAIRRLPYMSFDPYMCPERRWGATSSEELATCTDTADKAEWYAYQQFLRNHTAKDSTAPMGWSLQELRAINGTKVDSKLLERLDVEKVIREL